MLAGWPRLEQYKTRLFHFCQEALKGLEGLRKEVRERKVENQDRREVEEGHLLKIRIRPPVAPARSKTGRDELGGDDLVDGTPPRKKRRQEPRAVHNME